MDKITCDTIIGWLQSQYEAKIPVSPSVFVDSGEKLNILLGDEHERLFAMQQVLAKMKVGLLTPSDSGKKPSVAEVEIRLEADDLYREMCCQRAKIEKI